jgi:hypothetical protein
MPTLPPRPDFDQLRHQAKDLLKAHRSRDPEAIGRIQASHPRFAGAPAEAVRAARLTLSGAQLVIAREYGFASWPKLKAHVESVRAQAADPLEAIKQAFMADDAARVAELLELHPQLKTRINDPLAPFDSPAILCARSPQMLDVLLAAGADLDARSLWWAGGFGLLHQASPELAAHAVARGAVIDVHAAARLGMMDRLQVLVAADPGLVHARGGDGQTPLHFAATVEIAEHLLDHGADIDARDVDHESTPAQYMSGERQDVARCLVRRGCTTDVLLATALGDMNLVRRHLDADPGAVRLRVSDECFPMVGGRTGGTIYQWTLGFYVSAHQVARKFGHWDIYRLLMERSPADVRLIAACWVGDDGAIGALLRAHPDLASQLQEADRRQAAHAARNNDLPALRRLLEAGLPVDGRSQHQATPLHWAAFHGNHEMIQVILGFGPPLEIQDADFQGTPLRWAIHGSEHGWNHLSGDYAATVAALLGAGAQPPDEVSGSEAVREVLRAAGVAEPG